jgi:pyruvate/2-oxoacid:ferredoxin oxidoreductase alpha subunit
MGPGWNIWADHTDSMSQRDTGWIQFYCADNQEVFDTIIQTYKLCENVNILLPAMICLEAFILSHTYMPVQIPDQEEVDAFLPPYTPKWFLNINDPVSHGNIISPEYYMEMRHMMQQSMEKAKHQILQIDEEYAKKFGFKQRGLVEKYRCEDAEVILLTMGTIGSEAKIAVENLREKGLKIGSARVRVFRPFPKQEIRELAAKTGMLAIIDRGISFGMEGFLAEEVKASICSQEDLPLVAGFIAGLGGRDVTFKTIEKIALKSTEWMNRNRVEHETTWVDLKE